MAQEATHSHDKHLLEAQVAFERGDYDTTRVRLRTLLDAEPSDDVRRAAEELLDRTQPDRAATILAVACVLFFLLVLYRYVLS